MPAYRVTIEERRVVTIEITARSDVDVRRMAGSLTRNTNVAMNDVDVLWHGRALHNIERIVTLPAEDQ